MKPKLLIVDDDEEIRTQMKWALTSDYEIVLAGDRPSALEAFRAAKPQVVLLDLGLPPSPGTPTEGLATLEAILAQERATKVIVVSGQGEKETAIKTVAAGAYDFLVKPAEITELKLVLKRCFHLAYLEREIKKAQQTANREAFDGMVGTNGRMQAVFESIRKVATTEAPVLILGESGTGKEMAAQAIHQRSERREGPFVAINCSAIPESLIESELFGHEKGAFTGAHVARKGRIETANGGTLFLDEIGDVPLPIQVKLLRFLQERVIERVGGRQSIEVDTRVIAATNADLKKGMADRTFREDLFYRLAVVQLFLPPLRERDEDVVVLANYFLQQFAAQSNVQGVTFAPEAIRAMQRHAWPGNVRELQNRVRRGVIMGNGKRITPDDLELGAPMTLVNGSVPSGTTLREAREALEREMVDRALKKYSGKISAAAQDLGISRPTLYELMEKLGFRKTEEAPPQ